MSAHTEEGEVPFRELMNEKERGGSDSSVQSTSQPPLFYEDKTGNADLLEEENDTAHTHVMNQKKALLKKAKGMKTEQMIVEKEGKKKKKEKQQNPNEFEPQTPSVVKVGNDGETSNAACCKRKNILPVVHPDGSNTATISSFFIPSKSRYVCGNDDQSRVDRAPVAGSSWEKASRMWKKTIPFNSSAEKLQVPVLDNEAESTREPFVINDVVKKKVFMFIPSHSQYVDQPSAKSASTATPADNGTEEYIASNMWGGTTDEAMKSEAAFWEELHAQSQRKKNKKRNERRRLQKLREREERDRKNGMRDFEEHVKRVSMKRPEVDASSSQTDTEEEEEEKALRRVAHLWRKEERKMNKGPLEEGEMSVEERKKVLFRRNGFDLDCLFWGEV